LLGLALTPLPLFPLQPILARIVADVARRRPELFERLGPHVFSSFVIDVAELPFVLLLQPDPQAPKLTAHRRSERLDGTASIAGPFMALFKIIDGNEDSDALFFNRDIRIGGNTEAAVCLRNALDDLEGSVVDDVLEIGGRFFAPLRFVLARLRQQERTA
jgi:predicted lipid carrier protein YhbT